MNINKFLIYGKIFPIIVLSVQTSMRCERGKSHRVRKSEGMKKMIIELSILLLIAMVLPAAASPAIANAAGGGWYLYTGAAIKPGLLPLR